MLWHCLSLWTIDQSNEYKWLSAIKNPNVRAQLRTIQRAHDVAVGLGLTVPTWEHPDAH